MNTKVYKGTEIPSRMQKDFNILDLSDNVTLEHLDGPGVILIKKNGELHNATGPAAWSSYTGTLNWYIDGKLHRSGGPAIICYPKEYQEWYYGGQLIKKETIPRKEAHEKIKQELGWL